MADLSLDENQPGAAESLLCQAIPEFEKEQGGPDTISAYVILSHAQLMEGKLEDARNAAQHAAALVSSNSDPAWKLAAVIQNARIEAARKGNDAAGLSGIAAAEKHLHSAAATAKSLGYYQLECQARLELGELEMKNDPLAGRSELTALKKKRRF